MHGIDRVMSRITQIETEIASLHVGRAVGDFQEALNSAIVGDADPNIASISPTQMRLIYPNYNSPNGADRGTLIVREAMRHLGVPYKYGSPGPDTFDCSGLVQYVFKQFGVSLTHYTVTQAQMGTPVNRNEMRPGDVIFFGRNNGTGYLYHTGIYIGDNKFIHAPRTGDVVKIEELIGNYSNNWACARRYI